MSGERSIADIRETGAAWVTESELARVCDLAVRVEEPAGEPDEDLNREHTEHRIAEMSAPLPVPVGDETEALRAARTALIKFCREFDDYLDTTLVHDALGEIRKVRDRVAGLEAREAALRDALELIAHGGYGDASVKAKHGLRIAADSGEAGSPCASTPERCGDKTVFSSGRSAVCCLEAGHPGEHGCHGLSWPVR